MQEVHLNTVKLRERKSRFIRPFWKENKSRNVLCSQFYELVWGNGCPYFCEYCYLKGTFRIQDWHGGEQTIFSNQDKMWEEVEKFLERERPMVLHTGELCDSLAALGSDFLMARLIKRFSKQDKHTLLILTKSSNVHRILKLEHSGQTVIGFSVNPEKVAHNFERGAASIKKRLKAAQKCIDAGYPVMIRIDPMIPIKNWERHYSNLFNKINRMKLSGVVVGTLRAYPGLKAKISPKLAVMLTDREKDGRYHVPKNLRMEMYESAFSKLRFEYMGICKESGLLWGELAKKYGKKFVCNCLCNVLTKNNTFKNGNSQTKL